MLEVSKNLDFKSLKKYGFKKVKGARELDIYYMCISRGSDFIFISPLHFEIEEWKDNDPRIHKNPNVPFGYKSYIGALDIVYKLIIDGVLYSRYYKKS